jgi:peptidyl-prolyl cis-trans isomerase D
VVETEFGFHIIRLTDIRTPAPEPFDAARPRLETELKRQQAQRQYAEAAEDFSNMVYEQSDALAPAADKLGLVVRQASNVQRTGPSDASAHPALANPKVLTALFAADALRQKRNTEALEVGANQLVSARVLAHRPAATRPLVEVSGQVRELLIQQRAQEAARTEGQARLQAWQATPDSAALRPPVVVSRVNPQGLPEPALASALRAPAGPSVPAWASADLGAEGFAVLRVNRVLPREAPDAARAQQERAQLGGLWAQAESQAYLDALRARYKAKIIEEKLTVEP